jgi:hypothetical protein
VTSTCATHATHCRITPRVRVYADHTEQGGKGGTESEGKHLFATSDAYARGVERAHAAMAEAETPPPIDTEWCRFGAGLACLNGDTCRNPNHHRHQ